MANMDVDTGKWVLDYDIDGAGTKTITLSTGNKFVDKDIEIDINTPAGELTTASASASATSDVGILGVAASSQPASGHYVKVAGETVVGVTTEGFVDTSDGVTVTIPDKYYPLSEAAFMADGASIKTTAQGYVANNTTVGTISNGSQTIAGGTLSEGSKSSTVTSDGAYNGTSYDTSDKVKLDASESAGYYKIHSSGSAVVNRAAVTKQVTTAGYFAADSSAAQAIASGSLTVTNPDHNYFIKKSTLSASTVYPSSQEQTVTIGEGYYPDDRTITVGAVIQTEVTPTTGLTETGTGTYFDNATSSSHDISLVPTYSNESGFVAGHSNHNNGGTKYYNIKTQTVTETTTSVSGSTATRGTRTEGVGWNATSAALSVASFNNAATSGKTYVDISNTTAAPVLVSGDYLYIDKGWTDYVKISLAKLVPNGSDVKGHGEYILQGHSAYDEDGTLVAGTIATYDGSYSVA